MKKLTRFQKISLVVLLIVLIIVMICSWIFDYRNFFDVSAGSVISIFIALYLSFYLTQQLNDKREQIRHVEMMVLDIRKIINDDAFFQLDDEDDRKMTTVLHRRVSNKIDILANCLAETELQGEVQKMKESFQEAREFYGNHVDDIEYLKKSRADIMRYIEKIETCCDQIIAKLY